MGYDYIVADQKLLDKLSEEASNSKRLRKNFNFHQLEDVVQRFLNALEPDTYVRVHRHLNPPKHECFMVIRGSFALILFDDIGNNPEVIILDQFSNRGIDLQPGIWHTVISLEKGSIFFETKDGPYNPLNDKDFAAWAPEEGTPESKELLNKWKKMAIDKQKK